MERKFQYVNKNERDNKKDNKPKLSHEKKQFKQTQSGGLFFALIFCRMGDTESSFGKGTNQLRKV